MGLFLLCLVLGIILLLGLYWLIVLGEGTYLGPWAVRLVYHFGARHYHKVHSIAQATDSTTLLPLFQAAIDGIAHPAVLDVATGAGRVPLLLADVPGFRGRLVGIDLTPAMLEQARLLQQTNCPDAQIEWRVGNADRLDWPDAHFDVVSCLEALEYFPRPAQALAEMARVLRPSGTLILSTWPDSWAYLLPGRAFTRVALERQLALLGFAEVTFRAWQPGQYDLVVARWVRPVEC